MTDLSAVSEYEAKRLRRIEENHKKLQSLNLPVLTSPSLPKPKPKKRKRDVEEKPLEPTRKSTRQRKQQKLERQQWKQEKRERKKIDKQERKDRSKIDKQERKKLERNEKKKLKKRRKRKKLEKKLQKEVEKQNEAEEKNKLEGIETPGQEKQEPQEPRILDWRLRRKLQAQKERRQASLKRREQRKVLREKEKAKKLKLKLKERRVRKKQKARERMKIRLLRELEKQQRIEEQELMKQEDHLARRWLRLQEREAKQRKVDEKNAATGQIVEEILTERVELNREAEKKKEEARNRELYPVRQVNLPFVRISDAMEVNVTKPLVLTPLLKVDANLFHVFSLGKQFLPPGKKSVMQGLCPGGYTAVFGSDVDIHAWKNATTLFVNGTTGIFYHYMFEEATLRGRKHVFFRWTRCQDVTPTILERLRRAQKGDELLRFDNNYYDTPDPPSTKPEPLLLFVQYPKGPYIYCGRLGYLGYRSNPFEFSFQLLDINALNWRQLRTLITSC